MESSHEPDSETSRGSTPWLLSWSFVAAHQMDIHPVVLGLGRHRPEGYVVDVGEWPPANLVVVMKICSGVATFLRNRRIDWQLFWIDVRSEIHRAFTSKQDKWEG